MADISKNYVDLTRLQRYDGKIKNYISGEDAKSYKTILLSNNNSYLYFYKKENATLSDTADFSIDLEALTSQCYVPSIEGQEMVFRVGTVNGVPASN